MNHGREPLRNTVTARWKRQHLGTQATDTSTSRAQKQRTLTSTHPCLPGRRGERRESSVFRRHKHEPWPKRRAFTGRREGVEVCRVSAQVARAWTEKERETDRGEVGSRCRAKRRKPATPIGGAQKFASDTDDTSPKKRIRKTGALVLYPPAVADLQRGGEHRAWRRHRESCCGRLCIPIKLIRSVPTRRRRLAGTMIALPSVIHGAFTVVLRH